MTRKCHIHRPHISQRYCVEVWWLLCAISLFCSFVFSHGVMARRQDEITKKRHAKKRKDEITPGEITKRRNKARRKDEKTKCAARNDEKLARKDEKKAMRNNASLNFYFFVFRMASFRYFVFSPGVISSFRYFAWRFFVISSFRLAFFRLFAPPERRAKRRNNEKTPRVKMK